MRKLFICALCALTVAAMSGCKDNLDIKSDYGFSVTHLPVQKRIARGETAEIRLQIEREGRWDDARYFIRYFQPDGRGRLADENGTVFVPNDLYELRKDTFRLYYTSQSSEQHTIDLYFSDNRGKTFTLSFTFNNDVPKLNEWPYPDTPIIRPRFN